MFETCGTLGDLNKERQSRIRSGASQMEVNHAYNQAKARLLEETPLYRTIPFYKGDEPIVPLYVPFSILPDRGLSNEIVITPEGVLL